MGRSALSWAPNAELDLAGYRVYRSTSTPVVTTGTPLSGPTLLTSTTYQDLTAVNGTTYRYVVIAVDDTDAASAASAEVAATPSPNAGNALDFDGTNDHVTFGQATAGLGVTSFTLETWFRRDGAGVATSTGSGGVTNAIPLVTKGRSEADTPANLNANYFLGIDATTGTLVADFEDTATGLNHPVTGVTAIPISATVWHHAAVTYSTATDTWNLYLDGVLERTLSAGGDFTPESGSIQHAALATAMNSTGVGAGFFNGVLDEVRIWNVARTGAQIAANRDQQLTAGTGLIARYGLDAASGTTVTNSIAGGVNGTTVNGPLWVAGFPLPDSTPPAAPSGLSGDAQQRLREPGLDGQQRVRPGRLPGLPGHQPARGHDRQRPVRGAPDQPDLHRPDGRSTARPTSTSWSPSTRRPTASPASAPVAATPSVAAGAALDFDGTDDHVTFGPRGRSGGHELHPRDLVPARRRGGHREHRLGWRDQRHPARDQGPLRGRQPGHPQRQLLPGHRRHDGRAGGRLRGHRHRAQPPGHGRHRPARQRHLAPRRRDLQHGHRHLEPVSRRGPRADPGRGRRLHPRSEQHPARRPGHRASTARAVAPGFFNGVLDEVRIWNVARTGAQIAAARDQELTSGTGLIARYGLNEGTGTIVGNSIAGGVNGTATSGPIWVAGAPVSAPPANGAPVFSTELIDRTDAEGAVVSADADATDPDLDSLTYSATGLPGGVSINAGTGVISGTLSSTSSGNHNVTVTVSDGTATDTDTFTWTVTDTNQAPVFSTDLADQTDAEGDRVSLDADATRRRPPDPHLLGHGPAGWRDDQRQHGRHQWHPLVELGRHPQRRPSPCPTAPPPTPTPSPGP